MFRSRARAALRSSQHSLAPARTVTQTGRKHLTTAPPHLKSRGWKNSALRWGLAGAGIYYYHTSPVFAENPQNNLLNPNVDGLDDDRDHPTLDQLTASSRNKTQKNASTLQSVVERSSEVDVAHRQENDASLGAPRPEMTTAPATDGAAGLEVEAEGEGAFNPVTGEINWDCPCLGGMAYGPCGDEFRAAFSCFVYSNEDPKGMECIDKFQNMQTCFREHPEVYKGELEDDETLDGELAEEKEQLQKEIAERRTAVEAQEAQSTGNLTSAAAKTSGVKDKTSKKKSSPNKSATSPSQSEADPQPEAKTTSHTPSEYSTKEESDHGAPSQTLSEPQTKATDADATPESSSLVPKAAHDATDTSSGETQSIAK